MIEDIEEKIILTNELQERELALEEDGIINIKVPPRALEIDKATKITKEFNDIDIVVRQYTDIEVEENVKAVEIVEENKNGLTIMIIMLLMLLVINFGFLKTVILLGVMLITLKEKFNINLIDKFGIEVMQFGKTIIYQLYDNIKETYNKYQ